MSFYPLRHKYEGRGSGRGSSERDYIYYGETDRKFLTLKVSMKCMFIFPV
jgi:hypothetical protein